MDQASFWAASQWADSQKEPAHAREPNVSKPAILQSTSHQRDLSLQDVSSASWMPALAHR